jgi:diguanylate cyclase (GGDEF)-like protein/PAS domain S-box-containing protein
MYLMGAAAFALFLTDTVYTYISVQGIVYNQSGYLEAGWATFYLLWGAAALHVSMRTLSDQAPDTEPRLSKPRLVLLATASLMAPAVMFIQMARGKTIDMPVLIGASVALFLLVVMRMAGLVHKQELSTKREKALREAGAALVTATNRESIYEATLGAARSLAGPDAAIRVLAGQAETAEFDVVAATGGFEDVVGTAVDLSLLPEWKREQLQAHHSYQVPLADAQLAPVLGLPEDATLVMTLPLFMKDELRGLIVVSSVTGMPKTTRDSLEALTSQAALALDSAALTEEFLRRQSEARFSSLVQNSSDVVMVVDADSTMRWVSPSVERVLGYAPDELDATKLTILIHPEDKANVLQFLMNGGRDGDAHPALIEFRMRHQDGYWLHVETLRTNLLHDPNVKGFVLNTRDVSERKAFEEQLAHQAFHDSITGLANRALFRDRVEHALERQQRDDKPVSVLFMDLDDFKTINDSLGHAAGDHLLGEVGERLKNCLRAADTAARLGGDEFAVLLEDGGEGIGAADVAARILESLDAPFHLETKEVFVRGSIGIATADHEHEGTGGAEELLRNADVAMYMAKESGKNRYQIFEPAMHDTALKRLELKADLQRALDNDEFMLHYQPIIELDTGKVSGLEALLRWNHPQRGIIPPLDFIPLAEETGLIVPIGRWVLEEATLQGRALQERFPMTPPLHMAVNLSARQLQRPEIVTEVAESLVRSGLAAESLVLEITESVMMQDVELSLQRLTELKEIGIKLAVDDFGTGYSSLNYIQQFPVDILKVDKSFVDAFNTDARKSALTATIIKLAADLELRPVAEGIERADQLERLQTLHCDLGQGFYFAKPMPMDDIDELLSTRKALANRDAELTS